MLGYPIVKHGKLCFLGKKKTLSKAGHLFSRIILTWLQNILQMEESKETNFCEAKYPMWAAQLAISKILNLTRGLQIITVKNYVTLPHSPSVQKNFSSLLKKRKYFSQQRLFGEKVQNCFLSRNVTTFFQFFFDFQIVRQALHFMKQILQICCSFIISANTGDHLQLFAGGAIKL